MLKRYKKRHAMYRSLTETGHFLTSSSSSSSFGTSAPFSGYGFPDLLSPTFSVPAFPNSDARA
jgi:hypothetical protein